MLAELKKKQICAIAQVEDRADGLGYQMIDKFIQNEDMRIILKNANHLSELCVLHRFGGSRGRARVENACEVRIDESAILQENSARKQNVSRYQIKNV